MLLWSGVGGQLLFDHLLWSGVGGQLLSYHLLWSGVGGQLLSYHVGGQYCTSSLEGPFRGAFGNCLAIFMKTCFSSAALVLQNNLGSSSLRSAWLANWFDHVWIHTRISKWRQFSTRAPFHSCSVRSSHWGCNLSWMQSGRTLPHESTRIMVYQENTQNREIPRVRRSFVIATSEDFLNAIDPRDHLLLPTLAPIRVQRETLAKLIASLPEHRCLKGIAGWYANIAWLSDLVSWLVNVTNTVCSSKIGKKIFAKNGIFGASCDVSYGSKSSLFQIRLNFFFLIFCKTFEMTIKNQLCSN